MKARPLRFTVGRKMVAGLAVIVAIGMLSMLVIWRGLHVVEGAVNRLAEVEGPLNAAAYEMEVNVNGIGLAVLKYLATGRPEYRAWVDKDVADFHNYHANYQRLAGSAREQELAGRIGRHFAEFSALATTLMGKRDAQERLLVAVAEAFERIDRIIDDDMPRAAPPAEPARERYAKALALANIEAEAAEIAVQLAAYQRAPGAPTRAAIFDKMRAFEAELAGFMARRLGAQERALGTTLQSIYTGIAGSIDAAVVLEDEMRELREGFVGLRVLMDRMLDNDIQVLLAQSLDVPHREADAAAQRVIVTMGYLLPLFVLAAALAGYLLVRAVLVPLRRLQDGTEAVARGELGHPIARTGDDEFGELAGDFNRMVEQLRQTTVSKDLLERSEETLQHAVAELRHEIAERERAERERERLQARLRRSETMSAMGALVAGVAHEVRNPLFGISSTLDAMDARLGERPEYARYRQVLRGEVERLGKLMGDLLEFGRPTVEEMAPGRLGDAVAQAVQAAAPLAQRHEVAIDNGVPAGEVPVRMAPNRLMQAFVNLIENAIQHSPPGSTVRLDAQQVEADGRRYIDCAVRDAGAGIRADDVDRLFEPFFTRRSGGTGLGLSIVQRVVEEHGGRVQAKNHADGGALMTVRLPLETESTETEVA